MTLYVPPHFRVEDRAELVDFMRHNAFATLVSAGDAGLHASHVPLLVDVVGDKVVLRGHVARANPQWEALEGAKQVVAIFHGPPRLRLADVVRHASFGANVELRGRARHGQGAPHRRGGAARDRLGARSDVRGRQRAAVAAFGAARRPTCPRCWAPSSDSRSKSAELEGKFKLSQNRPVEIPRVAERLEDAGEKALARLMREHAPAAKG